MASQTSSNKNSDVKLNIVSLNVRGLRSTKKRRALFHLFKHNNYDIICLQETYLLKSDKELIEKEWGAHFHIAEGTKRSKGLLTLFSKKLKDMNTSLIIENERFLISKINIDDLIFTFLNVYAPCINNEKYSFFDKLSRYVHEFQLSETSNFIILGDFNTVLDNKLDIISGENHKDNIVNKFNNVVNDILAIDIWRYLHGKKREFSWYKNKPFIARRLDFILVSEDLLPFCKDSNIKELGFTDHKAVSAIIDFSTFKRGPSFFKFNVSLLNDIVLVNEISKEINRIKSLNLNPHLKWEYIKASISDIGKFYGRMKANEYKRDLKNITLQMEDLQNYILNVPGDADAQKKYGELKNKLEIINIREAEGARLRSGQKWAQEGGKCTKYFLSLEKQRSNANTIFRIVGDTGEVFRNPDEILNYVRNHFESLYQIENNSTKVDAGKSFIDDGNGNVLDEEDKILLNRNISSGEILNALKTSNNKSAPGSDGLPGEVYKIF